MHIEIPNRLVLNERAGATLVGLLQQAEKKLVALGKPPCILAEAPNKFNDAWYDDLWHAVQIGGAYWEQSQFFEGSPTAVIDERSWSVGDFSEAESKARGSEVSSTTINEARAILRELQRSNWRRLVDEALEGGFNLLALAIQHEQLWLCRTTPNGDDDGDIWIITDDNRLVHFGTCDQRIDQHIGIPCPVDFVSIHRDALGYVSEPARRYFLPTVVNHAAFEELSALLADVDQKVRATTSDPVCFNSFRTGWDRAGHSSRGYHDSDPKLVWRNERVGFIPPQAERLNLRTRQQERYPEEIYVLSVLLRSLEGGKWRELFGTAFGCRLEQLQLLSLRCGPDESGLVRQNTKFVLDGERLGPAQLCHASGWHRQIGGLPPSIE